MPEIRGLPRAVQRALVSVLALVLALPELDPDVERRTQWLKWRLEGHDPARCAEPSMLRRREDLRSRVA
jgi:hypothetical protein